MDRQIASPRPSPSGLVVTNGSNMFARASGAIPLPASRTSMRAPFCAVVETTSSRSPGGVSLIASQAFITRFSTTCCNCTKSPNTTGPGSHSRMLEIDAHQREHLAHNLVHRQHLRLARILLHEAADVLDDLPRAPIVRRDVVENRAELDYSGTVGLQQ